MKLVKPSFEIIEQKSGLDGLLQHIEKCGRTCYKSEDKITEESAPKFVDMLVNRGHCYNGKTEVLTSEGFVRFDQYKGQDVAVVNPDSTFKGFEKPLDYICQEFTGKMYNYNNLGISVTDGHKMFMHVFNTSQDRSREFEGKLHACNEPFKGTTYGQRPFKVATTTKRLEIADKSEEYYLGALLGFWISDGESFYSANYLRFHLLKERKVEFLKEVCLNLNLEFTECAKYTILREGIGKEFQRLFTFQGEKYLPLDFITSGIEYLNGIYEGLLNSDGSMEKTGTSYSSKSEYILNWILNTAPIVGYTATRGIGTNGVSKVFLLKRNTKLVNDSRTASSKVVIHEEEDIPVYCVTVSTGIIIVRGTNGVVTLCGNCAMVEHGTVYLAILDSLPGGFGGPAPEEEAKMLDFYYNNKYSNVVERYIGMGAYQYYITTNYRVLLQNDRLGDLQHQCEPTEYHEKRITVKFVCDRGITAEYNRHRVNSIAEMSTRYVAFDRDKFGGELSIIKPCWIEDNEIHPAHLLKYCEDIVAGTDEDSFSVIDYWLFANLACEYSYLNLRRLGWQAQQARTVLPLDLQTELVHTATIEQWKGFFKLRDAKDAHPQARELAEPLHAEFRKKGWVL